MTFTATMFGSKRVLSSLLSSGFSIEAATGYLKVKSKINPVQRHHQQVRHNWWKTHTLCLIDGVKKSSCRIIIVPLGWKWITQEQSRSKVSANLERWCSGLRPLNVSTIMRDIQVADQISGFSFTCGSNCWGIPIARIKGFTTGRNFTLLTCNPAGIWHIELSAVNGLIIQEDNPVSKLRTSLALSCEMWALTFQLWPVWPALLPYLQLSFATPTAIFFRLMRR